MLNISLADLLEKVKSPNFRLPRVIKQQKSDSYTKVFIALYSLSDREGFLELDVSQLKELTGLSRKTIYKVIAFLRRVNLLKLLEYRTGRGRHSIYQLNWRKPGSKKCHPLKYRKGYAINDRPCSTEKSNPRMTQNTPPSLEDIHKKLAKVEVLAKLGKERATRQLSMMCVRWAGWSYGLSLGEQKILCNAAGTLIWKMPISRIARLVKRLISIMARGQWVKIRLWLWEIVRRAGVQEAKRALFALLIKRMVPRHKPRPAGTSFPEWNEYLWHQVKLEKKRVMAKRAAHEASIKVLWERWYQEKEAERMYRRKCAELARKRLRMALPSLAPPSASESLPDHSGQGANNLARISGVTAAPNHS
jgi:hypothetical protein